MYMYDVCMVVCMVRVVRRFSKILKTGNCCQGDNMRQNIK